MLKLTQIPDLERLILSFLPPWRSLASKMCVAAFGRIQEDRRVGFEYSSSEIRKEMQTHTGILHDLHKLGACFGPMPSVRALKQRMRLIEELYLTIELDNEETRICFAPKLPVFSSWARHRKAPVLVTLQAQHPSVPHSLRLGFHVRLLCSERTHMSRCLIVF